MEVEFDPAKSAANIVKHRLSLARASDFNIQSVEPDYRFHEERRLIAFGLLDGLPHSLAFTMRGNIIHAISLRRAHLREYRRHVR